MSRLNGFRFIERMENMRRFGKRFFSGFLCVALAAVASLGASANASGQTPETDANYRAVLLYNEILSMSSSRSASDFHQGYGGAYIDAQDKLHVWLTEEASDSLSMTIREKNRSLVVEKAAYSFAYLSENLEILREHEETLSSATAFSNGISERDNRIVIGIKNASQENIGKVKALEGLDANTLLFEEEKGEIGRCSSTVASAGNMVNNGKSAVTVGFGCQYDGFDGFITVGHGLTAWQNVYQGNSAQGNKVGTVTRRTLSTTMDASFIRSDANKEPGAKVLTNGFFGGVNQRLITPEGTKVRKIGGISGNKIGVVNGNNRNVDFGDGVGMSSGFTTIDMSVIPGDSGAPIVMNALDTDNGGYILEGMTIGVSGGTAYYYSYMRIRDAMRVSILPYFS